MSSILTPSQKENIIQLNSPIHNKCTASKVSFVTPLRNTAGRLMAPNRTENSKDGFTYLNSKTDKLQNIIQISKRDTAIDDNIKWQERIEVVTKKDHEDYICYAASFIDEMISKAITISENKSEKHSCGGILKKTSHFSGRNTKNNSHTLNCEFKENDFDCFIDGTKFLETVSDFDLDFLAKKGSTSNAETDFSRQSLYAKFDPLCNNQTQPNTELPRKSDIIDFVSYVPTDLHDSRSRVTKSSVDFFFESPPALAVIEEEPSSVFQYEKNNISPEKESSLPDSNQQETSGFIVDVLKYSEEDIARIVAEHEEKWKLERIAMLEEQQKLKDELNILSILANDGHVQASNKYDSDKTFKVENETLIKRLKKEKSEILEGIDQIGKNLCPVLEDNYKKLKQYYSHTNSNMTLLQETCKKSGNEVDNIKTKQDKLKSDTTVLDSSKSEIKHILQERQIKVTEINGSVSRAKLRVTSLETALKGKQADCEAMAKICDELLSK